MSSQMASTGGGRKPRFVHPDYSLAPNCGVTYGVRYVGSVPVLASTRSLKTDMRNQVTRAAICMCCESAGLLMPGKKRRDKAIAKLLGDRPAMQHSGCSVNITVTTQSINVVAMDTQAVIANHDLVNVSFASGGDADTMDYVAYVAKDALQGRACYVIECPDGLASDVVSTIGQAFELRYKGLYCAPVASTAPASAAAAPAASGYRPGTNGAAHQPAAFTPSADAQQKPSSKQNDSRGGIGLEAPAPALPPRLAPATAGIDSAAAATASSAYLVPTPSAAADTAATGPEQPSLSQPWYHGLVTRLDAEALLKSEGDYLVRSASGQPGQFVLSGRLSGLGPGGQPRFKHLLLIDPEGRVRTRDRVFDSVEQLIRFHCDSRLPIVSEDSELVLGQAVHRRR
ncbi:hypothetical protein BOX15_Mlig024186g1 [Macrostomum lignano]|uniref:SHC-transforming protein 1 n=1 Tax=Macrostomum lignano TaxID=282301 RepID=A0A267GHL9_9PLAT|nr:hypothetical protein BOX15_Mlig024186g1 [Macrostomum lignano]